MSLEKYGINPAEALGLVGTGAVLGGLAVRTYMNSFLHDEGHRVFAAPNFNALQAIVSVCEDNGLNPSLEISDEKVVQALMDDNRTAFVVTRPDVWEEMGSPSAAPTFRVKHPAEAAEKARAKLIEKGFSAETISPTADQQEGEMVFVKTDALVSGLIGFRQHVIKMGPKPPKWTPNKLLGFTRRATQS